MAADIGGLKYTSQMILGNPGMSNSPLLQDLTVNKKDRKRQVWMRNSLSVSLWSEAVLIQKLDYIHKILSTLDCAGIPGITPKG